MRQACNQSKPSQNQYFASQYKISYSHRFLLTDDLFLVKHIPLRLAQDRPYPPLPLGPYHTLFNPDAPCDVFLTSMVGRAFLEWNSKVGIPSEVWYMVATAKVSCHGGCNKVRSFDGDCAHRDANGQPLCTVVDLSEEENAENVAPAMTKGKGRAWCQYLYVISVMPVFISAAFCLFLLQYIMINISS